MEALRPKRRLAEKTRRRDRAKELSEGYAAGTLSEADRVVLEQRRQVKRDRQKARAIVREGGEAVEGDWQGGVVVDLAFDELMSDQVRPSLHRVCFARAE